MINATYTYLDSFVDELIRADVRQAVVCPGSRSTPLAIALARRPEDMRIWLELDERSAGFFALGLARTIGQPVALLCTSGTAAANFMPAVVEAHYSRVPLLVLTADRPPELLDNGAPQAIDQNRLYGNYVKWFANVALPEASNEMLRYVRTLAGRAASVARSVPAGPIHLNFPLREPLTPVAGPLPAESERENLAWQGRAARQPFVNTICGPRRLDPTQLEALAAELKDVKQGLLIAGPQNNPALTAAMLELAHKLGWPVLADPLSQVRSSGTINNYDAFLRLAKFRDKLEPEVIIRFGAPSTSKPLNQYLAQYQSARMWVVDGAEEWREPSLLTAQMIWADPVAFCHDLSRNVAAKSASSAPDWPTQWHAVADQTAKLLEAKFEQNEELFEGQVFVELATLLPKNSTLFVGNSMPVRDLDTFYNRTSADVRIMCNRGANGIDGVVSSALGAAAGLTASGIDTVTAPLVLVIGDISFYHDMNGLLAAKMHKLNATIVLLNNDGGGIFSFLAQASHPEYFEQLFGTPHGLDFEPAAKMYGAKFNSVQDWPTFRHACVAAFQTPGLKIIEVKTNREHNVWQHRQLWEAIEQMPLEK